MKLRFKLSHPEIEGVESFVFEADQPLSWEPGQYMHYVLPHPNEDDKGTERWFTISTAPFEKDIRITTRFDGEQVSSFKQALHNLKPGDGVEADGPEGDFVINDTNSPHVFIAGGIGITPFRSMLAQLAHDNQPINVTLLYANRDNNFVFGEELKAIQAANPSFKLVEFADKHIEEADFAPYLANKLDKSVVITDYFPGY
jgi:ferredoxin-NADP reductase